MAKYDDASWHYGGEFPDDLPEENGATHIGMFINWCIDNDLMSEEQIEECEDDIEGVKNGKMTGAEFLINNFDEKFTDGDLNDIGNKFASAYYEDDTEFGKKYSSYMNDYFTTFEKKAEDAGSEYETIYHVENTVENYKLIKPVIDKRFEEWKLFNK